MNSFGSKFTVTIFGESHGPSVGCEIAGIAPGLHLCADDFSTDIARRAPSDTVPGSTQRRESDVPRIVSGLLDGQTTGAPLCIMFDNEDVRSTDYAAFASTPRPGHADYPALIKWDGAADLRGGGQFSGRMTLPVVAAGVIAKKMLPETFSAQLVSVGGSDCPERWPDLIEAARNDGDSLGGVVECRIGNVPIGLGEPFWDSIESLMSHAIFAIPGVRGIEFGDGFKAAAMRGSEHNDPIGELGPTKNGAGGCNGGLSNGRDIVFRVAFKPTSSIAKEQQSWNFATGSAQTISVKGRHDTCFALRTPVIVEAMAAIVLANL